MRLRGSLEGRMSCDPWQEAQFAAETCPPRTASPWNESANVLKRSLLIPYLVARRTDEWQGEQTSVETFSGATGDSGASAFLIVCSPWQSVQTGVSGFPFAIPCPCTLVL